MKEISVKSSVDGIMQSSIIHLSENENRPLLVGLHTWHHGRFDPVAPVHQSLKFYMNLHDRCPEARVFLDIFEGGHEIDIEKAFRLFSYLMKEKILQTVTG